MIRKAKKLERYRRLWELGIDALRTVDPVFADTNCTEIAVTYGFTGSPHRDKQNCGPFYGLSLGDFDNSEGKGGIVVESSARLVVQMNTKNRLGKVDGRYVHWVAPWGGDASADATAGATASSAYRDGDKQQSEELEPAPAAEEKQQQQQQRYSLIYYETGNDFVKPGPAVFSLPIDIEAHQKDELTN